MPYTFVLIEGKQMKKKPDLSKLNALEKSYKLDTFVWILNQTPDKEGNIAVFKDELDRMELEDNVSMYLGEYEVEIKNDYGESNKKIILLMPKEITKKYFDVIMSEEIYCRTEEEIIDQLERMYNDPLYVDYIKDLLKVVKREIEANNLFKDGSL